MGNQKHTVKSQILRATAKLLNEKNYLDITVTDIVKEAQIARVSFYRNYSSISDVFDAIADEAFSEFSSEILPVLESNDERKWRELLYSMFYRFPRHHSFLPDRRQENSNELFSRMKQKVQRTEAQKQPQNLDDKYLGCGKMGLVIHIIEKWMTDGQTESPEEMVNYIMTFITKF